MAERRPIERSDAAFAGGWTLTLAGGIGLLASAFYLGAPLAYLGGGLSLGGFLLIGLSSLRPESRAARPAGSPVAPPEEPPESLPVVTSVEEVPPLDESGDEPALPSPSFGDGLPAVSPDPSRSPLGGWTVNASATPPDPEAIPGAGPTLAPTVVEVIAVPSVSAEEPAPAAASSSPVSSAEPVPVVSAVRGDEAPTTALAEPPPWSEEPALPGTGGVPVEGSTPSGVELLGEVLPAATERSLAMLGLPWDPGHGPSVPPGPAAVGSPVEEVPEWSEAPILAFGPAAQRDVGPTDAPIGPGDRTTRSGGFAASTGPPEELSNPWVVPGLSVIRPSTPAVDAMGLVTRVPEPPARGLRASRRCTGCGEPSHPGATGENLCWGCGRPVCSSCFWRYGPGPAIHRCPSCAALGPPMSISGGRRTPRTTGPFASVEESEWTEGI